ncbi:TraR/DksA C4-type zinc finger protein [Mucilaginibacter yixingensis]|nr:TraR/DksA C4-type zinc finger protein [Mucilaginibacter yixingensis]
MENLVPKAAPTRYSDTELGEFKQLILSKMDIAQQEYKDLMATLDGSLSNDDNSGAYATLEDGAATLEKETVYQMAARQKKFMEQLEAALVRIGNKTYGICRATGKLIRKERLMAVPHTTLSMEAKLSQN